MLQYKMVLLYGQMLLNLEQHQLIPLRLLSNMTPIKVDALRYSRAILLECATLPLTRFHTIPSDCRGLLVLCFNSNGITSVCAKFFLFFHGVHRYIKCHWIRQARSDSATLGSVIIPL